jgi:hypothetical protein
MPSCSEDISSPPIPWTVARAQAALSDAANHLLAVTDLLEEVHEGLPAPPDIDDRQEGRKPYDVATDILGTIECVVGDDLWPAIHSLLRSAEITNAELVHDFHEQLQVQRRRP